MRCGSCPFPIATLCLGETQFELCATPKPPGPTDRELLPSVASCPDRGSVLPVSVQAECGCAELTKCGAGRGRLPGRVTLRECLACRRSTGGLLNP